MKDINKSIEKEIDEITSLHKKGLKANTDAFKPFFVNLLGFIS